MGKADQLLRSVGGMITESASHRGTPAAMPTAPAGTSLTPDRLAGVVRSKTALEIPLDKIEADPSQPREEFDEDALARLAASIGTRGVLQPIRVRWVEDRGRYVIVYGERRWRAASLAGLTSIPCVVSEKPLEPGELLAIQLIENALREDLKPIEQAKAFRTLMSANGWSGNQLSKELGISQSAVVQALALLELPETVQERVETGLIAPSTAYAIATLEDPEVQIAIADRAVSEGMNRAEVVRAVREENLRNPAANKGRGVKTKSKPTTVTIRTPDGCKVTIENRRGLDESVIRSALNAALSQLDGRVSAA